tara:strand:- start:8145 stop:8639 length:495 start_codon:yes stop_codon:yes gene_type:complete
MNEANQFIETNSVVRFFVHLQTSNSFVDDFVAFLAKSCHRFGLLARFGSFFVVRFVSRTSSSTDSAARAGGVLAVVFRRIAPVNAAAASRFESDEPFLMGRAESSSRPIDSSRIAVAVAWSFAMPFRRNFGIASSILSLPDLLLMRIYCRFAIRPTSLLFLLYY